MMASSADDDHVPVTPKRSALRSATLILPKTGERIRKAVTFGDSTNDEPDQYQNGTTDPATPETPLLGQRARSGANNITRRRRNLHTRSRNSLTSVWKHVTSKTGIGILKCSIAYVLGSMGTFNPILSAWLGDSFGKHMAATVTVYFHPARSLGSQFKAVFIALCAFLYAVVVCFTSMGVSIYFDDIIHMLVLGHVVVLIVFCGGGLGIVGWVKQRLGDPLVNVGCSLTSLAIITVLTKEGAVQSAEFSPFKIVQVLKMVILGVGSTTLVNVLIKPVSARRELKQTLIDTTDALGDMLAEITRAFLSGSEEGEKVHFQMASDRYKKGSTAMMKNLNEAQWEHYVLGTEAQSKLEAKLVKSIQQMYQNLGGLRSAAATQFQLLAQSSTGGATPVSPGSSSPTQERPSGPKELFTTAANENSSTGKNGLKSGATNIQSSDSQGETRNTGLPAAHTPAEMFEHFIIQLGPSMKSLAYTLTQILDDLPCTPAPEYKIKFDHQFHSSLVQAIELYSEARKASLGLLYRSKDLATSRPEAIEADLEEVAASCGHFSYSLLYFAEEMKTYLNILDELRNEIENSEHKKSWKWLKFWHARSILKPVRRDVEGALTLTSASPASNSNNDFNTDISPTMVLAKTQPRRDLRYRFWKAGRLFRRDDLKFAVKVGAGAAIYAMPSFVPEWRDFYHTWRGEWGLLSYMLVCSMTIGAANTTSAARIFGTMVGAVCSIAAWYASGGNVYVLTFFGWLMSLWNFYIIVGKGQGPFGRFIMLTYNLTALYAYAISVKTIPGHEDEGGNNPRMGDIALHRVVAVISGCLWGMFITRIVWPISARRKFRDGLSLLLLRMGLIWKRDPLEFFLEGESQHSYLDLKEELRLQKYLRHLEELCTAASAEYHLKTKWPKDAYSQVLKCVGRMLDAFHAINVIINKQPVASEGETALLEYTIAERAYLCRLISHLFQVLASSITLRFPLNDALPSTYGARDRLLARVFRFRKENTMQVSSEDEDYALLYAYVLMTGQISGEICVAARELETLFGTLDEENLQLR